MISTMHDPEPDEHPPEPECPRPVLPSDSLVVFPNPEKPSKLRLGTEDYLPDVTSRILLTGPPGSGKRNVILNVVLRMVPPPSYAHVVHCDPDTTEYDILGESGIPFSIYSPADFPTLNNLDTPHLDVPEGGSVGGEDDEATARKPILPRNPVVIVDEAPADSLSKSSAYRFERLVNHACTHRGTTLLCSIQSATNIPARVRRGFNHYVVWPQPDAQLNDMIARRCGVDVETIQDLFQLLRNPYEFIWIDLDAQPASPWRYRLNMMSPIERVVSGVGEGPPPEASAGLCVAPEDVASAGA
jgi:hypothetical protein